MPIPKPRKDESEDDFMQRCMSNKVMLKEFPEKNTRYGVCMTQWEKKNKGEQNEENK